jgi:hypothetical protein
MDYVKTAENYLAMAKITAERDGRTPTPAEWAAIGQGYAALAVAEGMDDMKHVISNYMSQ